MSNEVDFVTIRRDDFQVLYDYYTYIGSNKMVGHADRAMRHASKTNPNTSLSIDRAREKKRVKEWEVSKRRAYAIINKLTGQTVLVDRRNCLICNKLVVEAVVVGPVWTSERDNKPNVNDRHYQTREKTMVMVAVPMELVRNINILASDPYIIWHGTGIQDNGEYRFPVSANEVRLDASFSV